MLEQSALESLGDRVEIGERRLDSESGRTIGVVSGLPSPPAAPPVRLPDDPLPEELVRPWILPAVYERLSTGRGEFLAELRPAIPVFVHFAGIDFDEDDDAAAKLDDFVRRAQRICADYGGNLLQMTIGDKGAYLYAVFGSPHAHEDDGARAAAAALDLRALDGVTAVSDLKIGIAHGRLRSGTYGHEMRRTFVCLGDAVNLAARLMARAAAGQVYVSESAKELAGESFTWESLPKMTVKGKAEPVAVYALTGTSGRTSRRQKRYELEIVGRQAELAALSAALERTLELSGNVVGISAEAGLGKSRLVAEFVRAVRAGGGFVAFGECPAFGTNADYFVWQEIWRSLLGVDERGTEAEQRVAVERALEEIDPALVQRAPLLGPLLGITIPENDLTELVRRQAAQDIARRPARGLPEGSRGRGVRRDRARGLSLDRPARARPAHGPRPRHGGAARAVRARLPAGGRPRRRARARAAAAVRRAPARRARAGTRQSSSSAPSWRSSSAPGRTRRLHSWSSSWRARRATRSTSRSSSTTSTDRASTPRTRRRSATWSCRRACTA